MTIGEPDIEALGEDTYLVRARAGDEELLIRVIAVPELFERIGVSERDAPRIIRDTLAFLLDRQRADELPETLDLDDVVVAYDDYIDAIRRRATE